MTTKTKIGLLFYLFLPLFLCAQQSPVWSEDFSAPTENNGLTTGWMTEDISENEIETIWQRCAVPDSCPPYNLPIPAIQSKFNSKTPDNGYIYAYAYDNPFNADDFHSRITSPLINIEEADEELFLEYKSFLVTRLIREYAGTRLFIQADGGTWDERLIFPNVPNYNGNSFQKTHNANTFFTDLSDYVGATNIRLRWEWTGNREIVWCLDDIKLFDYNYLNVRSVWSGGDFSFGANGWTSNTNQEDSCNWEWESYGYYGDAFFPSRNDNKFINSPTARTGAMVINSDNCLTSNLPTTVDLVDSFDLFTAELISPTIDLSETNDRLLLDFYQVFRKLENGGDDVFASPFLFSYSIDDGTTWSDFIALNDAAYGQNITLHTHETLLLPTEIIGQSAVKIKFVFSGKLFYWGLDDIRILERAAYDLLISKDFFAIAPNYATPVSQLEPIAFLTDIENFGTEFQDDIWLRVDVENTDNETIVFSDSIFISQIFPLELVENQLFTNTFLPPPIAASYRATYSVNSQETDEIPENNSVGFDFIVTENDYAKERSSSVGFKPQERNYRWGNCFYLPHGEGFYADKVHFSIANIVELEGYEVQTELFEWHTNDMDTLTANPGEYDLIANNIYEVTQEDYEKEFISIPADFSLEKKPLKDATQYFLVVKYQHPGGDFEDCFLNASQELDYLGMFFTSELRQDIRYATIVDNGLNGVMQIFGLGNGSGFNIVPQVRLTISDSAVSAKEEITEEAFEMELFPNPTNGVFSLELSQSVNGNVLIYNSLGQVVQVAKNVNEGKSISVASLAKGTYFVQFLSEKEGIISTEKLIKL